MRDISIFTKFYFIDNLNWEKLSYHSRHKKNQEYLQEYSGSKLTYQASFCIAE